MAAKRFHIATPDQLQTLVQFTNTNACTVARMARIWAAAKKKHENTGWDYAIFVSFSGDRNRYAVLLRKTSDDKLVEFGRVKYNSALAWCERNLNRVYD